MIISEEIYQCIFDDLCMEAKALSYSNGSDVLKPYGTISKCSKHFICCYTSDDVLISEKEVIFKWDYPHYLVDFDIPKCDRLVLKTFMTFDNGFVREEGILFCPSCNMPMASYVPEPIDCAYFACLHCFAKTEKLDILVSKIPELLCGGISANSVYKYAMECNLDFKDFMESND